MHKKKLPYRLERLPVIYPFHYRARNPIHIGDLVYYGPSPEFYGVGEIMSIIDRYCIVDFRGTGELNVHRDAIETKYLIPIHKLNLSHILKEV